MKKYLPLVALAFASSQAFATDPVVVTPDLVVCETDFCKTSQILNSQINKKTTQKSVVVVKRNVLNGEVEINSTAVGNNLDVEVDAKVSSKHDDVYVNNQQLNKKTTQKSVVEFRNNRINTDVVEINSTAVGNNAGVAGVDRTIVESHQVNVKTHQGSYVNVTGNNAPFRDPVINSTSVGNNLSASGTVVKMDTAQKNLKTSQVSKVNYINNNLGPIEINSTSVGNNVAVEVK